MTTLLKKSDLSLDRIRQKDLLFLDAISGSHAYGTNTADSDEDFRGVFSLPASFHMGMEHIDQISDKKEDQQFFELTRFFSLLHKNNPTALELLFTPEECICYKNPAFDLIPKDFFLSKLCEQSFAGYAVAQIKKARGLNKKIVNPEPKERRHLRDFCYILEGQGSKPLYEWLTSNHIREEECGLVAVNHALGTYALFRDKNMQYRGIFSKKDDAAILCSSVPLEAEPIAWMTCNQDAFKRHCKAHREYWDWVSKRNESRYQTNASHGRGYDSKNMMHTLRLLEMAIEIATQRTINVRRPNADWLLSIKSGHFTYEELLTLAEEKLEHVKSAFEISNLPAEPNFNTTNKLLAKIRDAL